VQLNTKLRSTHLQTCPTEVLVDFDICLQSHIFGTRSDHDLVCSLDDSPRTSFRSCSTISRTSRVVGLVTYEIILFVPEGESPFVKVYIDALALAWVEVSDLR
jgi:hypothetical protein